MCAKRPREATPTHARACAPTSPSSRACELCSGPPTSGRSAAILADWGWVVAPSTSQPTLACMAAHPPTTHQLHGTRNMAILLRKVVAWDLSIPPESAMISHSWAISCQLMTPVRAARAIGGQMPHVWGWEHACAEAHNSPRGTTAGAHGQPIGCMCSDVGTVTPAGAPNDNTRQYIYGHCCGCRHHECTLITLPGASVH
jgi:hypothetical protein